MKLSDIAGQLGYRDMTPSLRTGKAAEVTRGYVSDLLSDVLANAPSGGILVTVQVHLNVVAVAVHAGLAAVVFANGRVPDDAVCAKAVEENVQLYVSRETAFELVGRLHAMGVGGARM